MNLIELPITILYNIIGNINDTGTYLNIRLMFLTLLILQM